MRPGEPAGVNMFRQNNVLAQCEECLPILISHWISTFSAARGGRKIGGDLARRRRWRILPLWSEGEERGGDGELVAVRARWFW